MGPESQLAVIEQALETASLMLGGQKARGHCLEMICADFLAGASLDASGNTEIRGVGVETSLCDWRLELNGRASSNI